MVNENLPRWIVSCSSPFSAGPTCVLAGLCRSAVTVAEETEGTSSVGDFERAGLAFLPSARGSIALGLCWPWFSVKVTDLLWSPCAVGTHACARGQNRDNGTSYSDTLTHHHHQEKEKEKKSGGRDGTGKGRQGLGGGCKTDMQRALLGEVADKRGRAGAGWRGEG